MRLSKQQKVRILGSQIAMRLGDDFRLCPEDQGPNFTWDNFPKMAKGLAEAQGPMSFSDRQWPKSQDAQLTQLIGDSAFETACAYVTVHDLWTRK
jgi:hypothetical protein